MIEWFAEREQTKTETMLCMKCGKKSMKTHYMKNPITLEWQNMGGQCSECGMRFIV
jgi:DNA-directed RNA polymerase subunit RPC12/RpoP